MTERETLFDLKRHMEEQLLEIERQIILNDVQEDDDDFGCLIKKAVMYRDTLQKIVARLDELT